MQLKNPGLRAVLILICMSSSLACSQRPECSPGGTVETFYQYLNAGEYSKAKELFSVYRKSYLEGELEDRFFREASATKTKQGTIDKVKIINSREFLSRNRREVATVSYEIIYKDGSSMSHTFSLTKEYGCWMLLGDGGEADWH